jgi:hypothetical protein
MSASLEMISNIFSDISVRTLSVHFLISAIINCLVMRPE